LNRFEIIVTVGPSVLQPGRLEAVASLGATILRLNGAHLDWDGAPALISDLRRRASGIRVMLDVSGRKVRLCRVPQPVAFLRGDRIRFDRRQINFPEVLDQVQPGTRVHAVDGIIQLDVASVGADAMELTALTDGTLQNGKGLHFDGARLDLPPTSELETGHIRRVAGLVDHFGLSFVHTERDLDVFREAIGDADDRRILPKIETRQALENCEAIVRRAPVVLVDRGDLASEIGMHAVVPAVRRVIEAARRHQRPVVLATHFLRTMVQHPAPTMSEVFDLHYVLSLGVDGIQFSDETAVGRYPEECLRLLREALGR
jgi:pyruvate kinase